ncbi:hypothetical protein EDB19DRAFT_1827548 [Suillus lakei]|nr:hypothetical protein EDB19DRAFT_1827548 [Suillus lakei]
MASSPPKYDDMMRPALPLWSSPRTRKNEVVVELSRTQPPPLFPIGLQNYVSPHMWETRIVWQARLVALVATVGLWFVMFLPIAIWKYIGRVRVNKMIDHWAKDDVRSASSYAAIPTWKVTMPGMFRDGIVLAVSFPAPPSSFELENLPPYQYIAPPTDAAPSYEAAKRFSGLQGDGKFGEIPLYNDAKEIAA